MAGPMMAEKGRAGVVDDFCSEGCCLAIGFEKFNGLDRKELHDFGYDSDPKKSIKIEKGISYCFGEVEHVITFRPPVIDPDEQALIQLKYGGQVP